MCYVLYAMCYLVTAHQTLSPLIAGFCGFNIGREATAGGGTAPVTVTVTVTETVTVFETTSGVLAALPAFGSKTAGVAHGADDTVFATTAGMLATPPIPPDFGAAWGAEGVSFNAVASGRGVARSGCGPAGIDAGVAPVAAAGLGDAATALPAVGLTSAGFGSDAGAGLATGMTGTGSGIEAGEALAAGTTVSGFTVGAGEPVMADTPPTIRGPGFGSKGCAPLNALHFFRY
jgi:hypothetical protein